MTWPAFFFTSAATSFSVLMTGLVGETTNTLAPAAIMLTEAISLTVSYGSFGYSAALPAIADDVTINV